MERIVLSSIILQGLEYGSITPRLPTTPPDPTKGIVGRPCPLPLHKACREDDAISVARIPSGGSIYVAVGADSPVLSKFNKRSTTPLLAFWELSKNFCPSPDLTYVWGIFTSSLD